MILPIRYIPPDITDQLLFPHMISHMQFHQLSRYPFAYTILETILSLADSPIHQYPISFELISDTSSWYPIYCYIRYLSGNQSQVLIPGYCYSDISPLRLFQAMLEPVPVHNPLQHSVLNIATQHITQQSYYIQWELNSRNIAGIARDGIAFSICC
jgi:hypothetical protein